ncbi:DNA ligase [Salix suchowensis]|nr:DNA ligase [Salix suchowensis]
MKKKNPSNREEDKEKINGPKSMMNKKKKNMKRLGGAAGLSLEAFVNAKSNSSSSFSNPAIIKKQREFYKNAKYVSKFKKKLKQQHQPNELPQIKMMNKNKRSKNSLKELYEKRREEEERATVEREAILKEKKEGRERAESAEKRRGRRCSRRPAMDSPL